MDDINAGDMRQRNEMEHASKRLLDAMQGKLVGHSAFAWNGRGGKVGLGHLAHKQETQDRLDAQWDVYLKEQERIDGLRVSRDPCPRCNARGDYDCGHKRR